MLFGVRPLGNRYAYTKVYLDEARVIGAHQDHYSSIRLPSLRASWPKQGEIESCGKAGCKASFYGLCLAPEPKSHHGWTRITRILEM